MSIDSVLCRSSVAGLDCIKTIHTLCSVLWWSEDGCVSDGLKVGGVSGGLKVVVLVVV